MMRMVREINSSLLPQTGRDTTRLARVSCVTCHHGARRPETLADTLQRAIDQGGAPAAIASYRALRDQYYGRAVYDFGESSLSFFSERFAVTHPEIAMALLELNLEWFPKSVNTRVMMGDRLAAKGDTAAAVQRWQEALALDPGNRFVQSKAAGNGRRAASSCVVSADHMKDVQLNVEELEERIAPSNANFPPGQFPAGNPAHAPGNSNANQNP